jgi:dTDP-4-amino-4,6-dideoxygalactose transaminase
VPKEYLRPELEDVKQYFQYEDARDLVDIFEREVAYFAGSQYAVSTDCCTHAIELSLRLKAELGEIRHGDTIIIPEYTYVSLPMTIAKLGLKFKFHDLKWEGLYKLDAPGITTVVDGAVRWRKDMYIYGSLHCLSFQIKKRIPIGRGGMILTDNKDYYDWLRFARYDGRDMDTRYTDKNHIKTYGYHYYMTPEDAARGLILMQKIKEQGDTGFWNNYPNLREWLKEL